MAYKYSDIPDKYSYSKRFWPLGRHLWRVYKEMGWEIFEASLNWVRKILYQLISMRLDETILTAQDVLNGNIKPEDAPRILTYPMFPPLGCIRSDLQQGTMKLLYGESSDVSYIALDDMTGEILLLINGHVEDGIPVDWWIIDEHDEILNRRHQKLGYKLRELPKKFNFNMNKAGYKVTDILKDVRNERTPQWSQAPFISCLLWMSGAMNIMAEPSSWEAFTEIWDGICAKKQYGLPDSWMTYIPWPPMIGTIIEMGRLGWQLKINGLFSGGNLYLIALEEPITHDLKDDLPEFYHSTYVSYTTTKGIPKPVQTLQSVPPKLKDKKTYEKEAFDWTYPDKGWIQLEDLDMDIDEMHEGVLLDVTHETPIEQRIDSKDIISRGIGRATKFEQRA